MWMGVDGCRWVCSGCAVGVGVGMEWACVSFISHKANVFTHSYLFPIHPFHFRTHATSPLISHPYSPHTSIHPAQALFLQHVLPLLDNHTAAQHNTDAAAQLSNAISLLTLLLKHADGHMVQRVGVMLLPRLLVVGETCTDPQVGQEVTEALR